MVSQNTTNLENFGGNDNVDVHNNEIGDEASQMTTSQQSLIELVGSSRSNKVKGFDSYVI